MDYANFMGELAGWETPFPAQVQPGRIRKEGATLPLPAQVRPMWISRCKSDVYTLV